MTAAAPAVNSRSPSRLRWFLWLHPEWWLLSLCCLAWASMLFHASRTHAHMANGPSPFSGEFLNWIVMVVAMMLPLVIPNLVITARSSLWCRRHRAICAFLLGYLVPWCGLGVVASAFLQIQWTSCPAISALLFISAALWQRTSTYRGARIACHGTQPLRPTGWKADRDCFRYGSSIGVACLCACWPVMLACAFTGHALIAMLGGSLASFFELRSRPSENRLFYLMTLGLGVYFAALATVGSRLSMHM
jgi:predicted metal-binding membrane protein